MYYFPLFSAPRFLDFPIPPFPSSIPLLFYVVFARGYSLIQSVLDKMDTEQYDTNKDQGKLKNCVEGRVWMFFKTISNGWKANSQ